MIEEIFFIVVMIMIMSVCMLITALALLGIVKIVRVIFKIK